MLYFNPHCLSQTFIFKRMNNTVWVEISHSEACSKYFLLKFKMSYDSDDEIGAVFCFWNIINSSESKRRMWIHPLNLKRTEDDLINTFFEELCQDREKFKNFTRMEYETFNKLLNLIETSISKSDTNFRKSISAKEKLLVTLR